MKTILPWVLVVAFAAAAGAMYFSKASADAELAKARDEAQQADTLRGQLDDAQKQVASLNDQVATLSKNNEELLRLRHQVQQLGDEKAQLQKQLVSSQSEVARSQDEVQRVQAATSANARAMAEQQILQMKQNQAVVSTCINNLRQIQAAKQQWALENSKTADAVPTPLDLAAYLPNHQMPECPGGGRYTINAVGTPPTCSIPGHVLQ